MPTFYMHISDGREAEVEIEARDAHDALNAGLNALAQFACKAFPPPENVSISVMDTRRIPVAKMEFDFKITYAPGVSV